VKVRLQNNIIIVGYLLSAQFENAANIRPGRNDFLTGRIGQNIIDTYAGKQLS
jgi:hypothetical protein